MDDVKAMRLLKQGKIDGLEYFVVRYQVKASSVRVLAVVVSSHHDELDVWKFPEQVQHKHVSLVAQSGLVTYVPVEHDYSTAPLLGLDHNGPDLVHYELVEVRDVF